MKDFLIESCIHGLRRLMVWSHAAMQSLIRRRSSQQIARMEKEQGLS